MATINGTVINDANNNGVQDTGESGLSGWTVFLDQNANGVLDSGETSTTTDANGNYTFTNLASDTYIVTQQVPTGFTQTFPTAAPASQFNIDIIFTDSNLTASQQAIFNVAADIWESIIIGDVPDRTNFELPSGNIQALIDDLAIEVSAPAIDGPGNILGQAGPRYIRGDSALPITGIMEFDSADVARLENNGQLEEVILHEMGHVIGIGTIWDNLGLITGAGTNDPRYTGETGTAQYNIIFGNNDTFIPLETQGGAGTRDSHWSESVFFNELLTGFLNGGVNNPLSRISAGSLKDLGYEVDLRPAENYTPPSTVIDASSIGDDYLDSLIVTTPEIEVEVVDEYNNGIVNTTTNSTSSTASASAPAGTYLVTVSPTEDVNNLNFGNFECFLTGTHILTDKGEITVENLKIEDKVKTAEGKFEPIKWIGKQTCQPNKVKNPLRSYPILIKAGALGNNLPHRDLYVSPDHAMFFEGLLINAGALVNDVSIIKTEPKETFTYYHIELDNHALLIAEGASAESYLPQKEDRLDYDNGAEYEKLYPHGSNLMLWPMDYPRISSWVKVPRYVRNKLNSIAAQLSDKLIRLTA